MIDSEFDCFPVATARFKSIDGSATEKPDYCFTSCNQEFKMLFGMDVIGKPFSIFTGDFSGLLNEISLHTGSEKSNFIYIFKDGRTFDARLSFFNDGFIVCVIDLGLQKCPREDEFCKVGRTLKSIPAGIITTGKNGKVTFINTAARQLIGWEDGALGMPIQQILNIHYVEKSNPVDFYNNIIAGGKSLSYNNNVEIVKKDGELLNISLSAAPIDSFYGESGIVIFFRDASKEILREKEILYLSYHDKLTGLYNRPFFENKLKELDKSEYYPVSIIIGDTNGLKMTNDVFGHKQGDLLLGSIANILSLACRETDIVARYGGDEFTILMPNTTSDEAAAVCHRILTLCNDKSFGRNRISISLGCGTKEKITQSLNDVLNIAENIMYRNKLLESKSYRSSVISSIKEMLFEKSFETEEHAMRITGLCLKAGRIIGLSESDLNDLELFSMLHDIGKIGVKDSVLTKPGKLNDEEWAEMKRHCEVGYRIAQSAPELSHIADYILCHHERWDGLGYPQGLKGTSIPLLSRILSVADAYDAIINDRYYRKAQSHSFAIQELKRCSGNQFDPDVINVFLQILDPASAVHGNFHVTGVSA